MTINLYFSYAVDLFAVVLMGYQLIRIHKLSGEKGSMKHYFRLFSWLVLIMAVLHLLKSYSDLQSGVISLDDLGKLSEAEEEAWYITQVVALIADIFLSTLFLYMWVTFLSWYLFEDRDFIKRRFWIGFVPLIVTGALSCVSAPMALMSELGYIFFIINAIAAFVVRVFYFLIALWLLREYKRQNGYLRFFNPYAFFLPVAASWLVQDILFIGVGTLGTTIGVIMLYSSIVAEDQYKDPTTGLYNMDFVDYLKNLIDKKQYSTESAMLFTVKSSEETADFSEILKKQLPADCEPILRNDHEIVVFTSVNYRPPLDMVIEDVKAETEVKASCCLRKKNETAKDFMERVL